MGYILREYGSLMRIRMPDGIREIAGRWHFCPPGAIGIPFMHPYMPTEFRRGPKTTGPVLGEVPSSRRKALPQDVSRYTGKCFIGNEDDWNGRSEYPPDWFVQVDIDGVPTACCSTVHRPGGTGAGGGGHYGSAPIIGSIAGGAGVFGHVGSGGSSAGGAGVFGHVGSGGSSAGGAGYSPLGDRSGTEAGGAGLFGHVGLAGSEANGAGVFGHVGSGGTEANGEGVFGHEGAGGSEEGGSGEFDAIGSGGTSAQGSGVFGHEGSGGTAEDGEGVFGHEGSGGTEEDGEGVFGHEGAGGTEENGSGEFGHEGSSGSDAGGAGVFGALYMSFATNKFDFDHSEIAPATGNGVVVQYTSSNGGAVVVNNSIVGMYFVAKLTTGAISASGSAALQYSTQSATAFLALQSNTSNEVEFRIKIPTLSVALQRFKVQVGFMDAVAGAIAEGVWFEYIDNVNSGQWTMQTKKTSGGAGNTTTNSTSAPVAGTVYLLKIVVTGTSAEFFVNGVSIGTVATNVPSASTGIGCNIIKSVGTTSLELDVDYIAPTVTF